MKEKSDSEDEIEEENNFNNNDNKNIDFLLKEKEDPLKSLIKEKKPIEIENKEIEKEKENPIEIENKKIEIEKEKENPIEIENKEIEIENEKDDEEELKDINLEDIKMSKKIICPEDNCFLNTIIILNPITFEIKSDCGKHKNKLKIIQFVEKSGIKDEKIFCSICKNTYKDIFDNKKYYTNVIVEEIFVKIVKIII